MTLKIQMSMLREVLVLMKQRLSFRITERYLITSTLIPV
ncbi:hypothetical protein NC652_021285 [Populus alba x Populus x berolinensis]|nr:hypothetical protein NC652_021285 [Populus alba x Populus x berolinensis]